jgi:hypothetical protein
MKTYVVEYWEMFGEARKIEYVGTDKQKAIDVAYDYSVWRDWEHAKIYVWENGVETSRYQIFGKDKINNLLD